MGAGALRRAAALRAGGGAAVLLAALAAGPTRAQPAGPTRAQPAGPSRAQPPGPGAAQAARPGAPPAGPPAAAPGAVRVAADWFSCDHGKYAIRLSRHYPSLLTIGRYRIVDLDVRQLGGGVTATTRRFHYTGLQLDVLVLSSEPQRYTLLAAEVTSRRWHIGRFSVGTKPWPWLWSPEDSLAKVRLHGPIQLVGHGDSAAVVFNEGRVERVSFTCRAALQQRA